MILWTRFASVNGPHNVAKSSAASGHSNMFDRRMAKKIHCDWSFRARRGESIERAVRLLVQTTMPITESPSIATTTRAPAATWLVFNMASAIAESAPGTRAEEVTAPIESPPSD